MSTSRVGSITIGTDGAGKVDMLSLVLLFATSRMESVVIKMDGAGEADNISLMLLFATSRLGSIAIVTDKAGEADRFESLLVLLFATSRAGSIAIVTDRAGEMGKCSLGVLSEPSIAEAEDLQEKFKSCHICHNFFKNTLVVLCPSESATRTPV